MENIVKKFLKRMPLTTLIATGMCSLGVWFFCVTIYRGSVITLLMLDEIFHLRLMWIEGLQLVLIAGSGCMGALVIMLICLNCLTTGDKKNKMYRTRKARICGKISCAFLLMVTYLLTFAWILLLCFLAVTTFLFTTFWKLCSKPEIYKSCIDLTQFDFMFPSSAQKEGLRICGAKKMKLFCDTYVNNADRMFILASVFCILVILSLVHYLMCLSANYAHIGAHEKVQELLDLIKSDQTASKNSEQYMASATVLRSLDATTKM